MNITLTFLKQQSIKTVQCFNITFVTIIYKDYAEKRRKAGKKEKEDAEEK